VQRPPAPAPSGGAPGVDGTTGAANGQGEGNGVLAGRPLPQQGEEPAQGS
jgi:hypothetical protein